MKIQEMQLNYPPCRLIRGMIAAVVVLVTCHGWAQFSPDVTQELNKAIAKGDFHAVSLAVEVWESRYRAAPDDQKLPFIKDAISFAAAILANCDPSLHSAFDIGPEPPFDWQKYGIKPLFNGVSPDTIENPEIRDAYKMALADHKKLMVRVSAERHKLEEGDYCARVAFRVVESSANRTALREATGKYIASIQGAEWIRERLTHIVLPKPPSETQSSPQNDSTVPASTSQPQPGATTPSLSSEQPPTPKNETTPTTSSSIKASSSSTPWSIIVVLIVGAGGLLWLLLKWRKNDNP